MWTGDTNRGGTGSGNGVDRDSEWDGVAFLGLFGVPELGEGGILSEGAPSIPTHFPYPFICFFLNLLRAGQEMSSGVFGRFLRQKRGLEEMSQWCRRWTTLLQPSNSRRVTKQEGSFCWARRLQAWTHGHLPPAGSSAEGPGLRVLGQRSRPEPLFLKILFHVAQRRNDQLLGELNRLPIADFWKP